MGIMTGVGRRGEIMGKKRISEEERIRTPGALSARRRVGGRHGRGVRDRYAATVLMFTACLVLLSSAAGCGGDTPNTRPTAEQFVEKALLTALSGKRAEFVGLVAPSFLEVARAEMPDVDDETLGGVLIAGFLEDIPFSGIIEAQYGVWEYAVETGQTKVVYVSGRFIDGEGNEMVIGEADAIRIPLYVEEGRLYIDLLDL